MSSHTIPAFISLHGEDVEVSVSFDYSRGRPGVHTLRNGDPGYPDEPDEIEVSSVLLNGEELSGLPEDTLDRIEQACWDYMSKHFAQEAADEYEAYQREKAIQREY